jgi:hypothetical protein
LERRQRPTAALARNNHDVALASLVFSKAAVLAIDEAIGGADVPTEVCAIHLDLIRNSRAVHF